VNRVVPGAGLVMACLGIASIPNLVESPRTFLLLFAAAFGCYLIGVRAFMDAPDRGTLAMVLGVAAAARLVLLPASPSLSTDAFRYVWDARVAAAGINPYTHAPSAPEVESLRDGVIHPRLNHPTWRTIYPPGAQLLFRAIYRLRPDSVMAMKVAVCAPSYWRWRGYSGCSPRSGCLRRAS
jgi:alpha-1,6-mannosyltransferase